MTATKGACARGRNTVYFRNTNKAVYGDDPPTPLSSPANFSQTTRTDNRDNRVLAREDDGSPDLNRRNIVIFVDEAQQIAYSVLILYILLTIVYHTKHFTFFNLLCTRGNWLFYPFLTVLANLIGGISMP
jgi:hypothetical protein